MDIIEYKKALQVQSACNLTGVLNSMLEVARKVREEGGDWHHPILRMYAEQVSFLTGGSSLESYQGAYKQCETHINGGNDESNTTS